MNHKVNRIPSPPVESIDLTVSPRELVALVVLYHFTYDGFATNGPRATVGAGLLAAFADTFGKSFAHFQDENDIQRGRRSVENVVLDFLQALGIE